MRDSLGERDLRKSFRNLIMTFRSGALSSTFHHLNWSKSRIKVRCRNDSYHKFLQNTNCRKNVRNLLYFVKFITTAIVLCAIIYWNWTGSLPEIKVNMSYSIITNRKNNKLLYQQFSNNDFIYMRIKIIIIYIKIVIFQMYNIYMPCFHLIINWHFV